MHAQTLESTAELVLRRFVGRTVMIVFEVEIADLVVEKYVWEVGLTVMLDRCQASRMRVVYCLLLLLRIVVFAAPG